MVNAAETTNNNNRRSLLRARDYTGKHYDDNERSYFYISSSSSNPEESTTTTTTIEEVEPKKNTTEIKEEELLSSSFLMGGDESVVVGRIVGGSTAGIDEYPFFVSWDGCAASLVAPDVLLTAAHCRVLDSNEVYINRSRTNNGIRRTIVQREYHPLYNPNTLANDYMVLKLDTPVFAVTPVRLNTRSTLPISGQDLTVIGFGRLDPNDGTIPNTLQKVTVQYISTDTCQNSNQYAYQSNDIKGDVMFCAGVNGGGQDSCQGDSGGPIFVRSSSSSSNNGFVFTQMGIVSWGIGCANARYPGVYSRISGQMNWIRTKICDMTQYPSNIPTDDNDDNDFCNNNDDSDDGPTKYYYDDDDTTPSTGDGGSGTNNRVKIRLDIEYDKYPQETGWAFSQDDDIPLYLNAGSLSSENGDAYTKRTYTTYLMGGREAKFQITDASYDGLCCRYGGGPYTIHAEMNDNRGDVLLIRGDGIFTSGRYHTFTVPSVEGGGGGGNDSNNNNPVPTTTTTSRAPTPFPTTRVPPPPTPSPMVPTPSPVVATASPTTLSPTTRSPVLTSIVVDPTPPPPDNDDDIDSLIRNFCTVDTISSELRNMVSYNNNNNNQQEQDDDLYVIEFLEFKNGNQGRKIYHEYMNTMMQTIWDTNNIKLVYNTTRKSQFPRETPVWDEMNIVRYSSSSSISGGIRFRHAVLELNNPSLLRQRENALKNSIVYMASLNTDIPTKYPELIFAASSNNNNDDDDGNMMMGLLHGITFQSNGGQDLVKRFDQDTYQLKRRNGIRVRGWLDIQAVCIPLSSSSSSSTAGLSNNNNNNELDQIRLESFDSYRSYAKALSDPQWIDASELRSDGTQSNPTFTAFTDLSSTSLTTNTNTNNLYSL